jgi:hypothetical protein
MLNERTSELLAGLRTDLGQRQIGDGMARLDELWSGLSSMPGHLDPHNPDSAALLCYVAQWVDAGWRDVDIVQNGLGAFPKGRRSGVRLTDYVHILMAEGMVWVNEERVDRALENFSRVLSHPAGNHRSAARSLAHFWSARCHRKNGEIRRRTYPYLRRLQASPWKPAWSRWRPPCGGRKLAAVPERPHQRTR